MRTSIFDHKEFHQMKRFVAKASLLLHVLCILSGPSLARANGSPGDFERSKKSQIRAIKNNRNLASVTFTTVSSFQIFTTSEAKENCNLHETAKQTLDAQGFTKILCPFGVLVVGDSDYPDDGLKYGANIVANLLDNNNDGIVDDAAVLGQLAQKKVLGHGAVLMCGSTRAKEQKESFFEEIFAYSFSCQTFSSFGKATEFKAIMFEESFHMIHQNGWAVSYPDIFGLDSYTSSVVCRETARHQCTSPGYFHPENTCPNGSTLAPGSPQASPLQGTCNDPSCDCAEFYRQAATAYMNWVGDLDFWYADHMPNNKSDFVSMSSSEMLSVMENPAYHQPQAPLSGVYTQTGMTGTLITPSPTQAPTTAAPVPDPSPAPTTAAPTASPPTTTGTCFDSVEQFNAVKPGVEGWTKLKTCDEWVNRKSTPWRCKNVGGVKENCPKTCTNCCVETIGTFILKYNGNEKDCAWAAINPSVRCRKPPTRMNCAVVCGECE